MSKYETTLPSGPPSERLSTAFYRFLELHNADVQACASMTSEPLGQMERKTITLWSDQAVAQFANFVRSFAMPPPPRGMIQVDRRFEDRVEESAAEPQF